jgi:transglutaminase-like putative cysteine protease
VRFDNPLPGDANPRRYWRGPVLHHFAHGTWSRGKTGLSVARVRPKGRPVRYTVTLQPDNHDWLYTLAVPASWPAKSMLASDYTLYAASPVRQRRRYTVVSYPHAAYGLHLPSGNRRRDLQLPANGNPHARQLASKWRRNLDSPKAIVQHALAHFADGDYYYTLKPAPLDDDNGIDEFLFQTQSGFCGHYASAFAFLMRAAGVPAHIVTGYEGGEHNPVDHYWTIRDARAHAWVEVWLAGVGWKRVDPTAALPANHIAPEAAAAIHAGSTGDSGMRSWLHGIGYAWIAANTFWNQWVMSYGPSLQKSAFARLGVNYDNWLSIAMTMFATFVVTFGIFGAWFASRSWLRRGEPVTRLYRRFCRKLARVGVVRHANEGPLDFATRATRARPDCGEAIGKITRLYVALRYGRARQRDELRGLTTAVANFQPERRI